MWERPTGFIYLLIVNEKKTELRSNVDKCDISSTYIFL